MAAKDSETSRPAAALSRAADALGAARDRTASAYEAARGRATDATRKATEQLSIYPIGAVIGGFAVGALIGALLPRTESETRALGATGRRLTGAAREAAQRGIEAGREQIEEIRTQAAQKVGEAVTDAVGGKP